MNINRVPRLHPRVLSRLLTEATEAGGSRARIQESQWPAAVTDGLNVCPTRPVDERAVITGWSKVSNWPMAVKLSPVE